MSITEPMNQPTETLRILQHLKSLHTLLPKNQQKNSKLIVMYNLTEKLSFNTNIENTNAHLTIELNDLIDLILNKKITGSIFNYGNFLVYNQTKIQQFLPFSKDMINTTENNIIYFRNKVN